MVFLRILGKTFLAVAFVALAYDGARTIATPNEGILLTSLSAHLKTFVPGGNEDLQRFFLANGPAYVWSAIVEPLIHLPVSIASGALGAVLFLAGYRRPPAEIIGD